MSGDRDTGVGVADSPTGRLQALFEGRRLTPTQRRIAHSMVRRAADVPFLSSVELAELAGVSQPSVTRFAVALGFDTPTGGWGQRAGDRKPVRFDRNLHSNKERSPLRATLLTSPY